MATENKATQKKEDKELLKAIAGVLDEALSEYETLAKTMDIQMAEDPSKPFPAAAAASDDSDADDDKDKDDEDEDEDEDKDEDKDKEMDDETLKSEFARISAEVEKRGLNKSATKAEDKKETETMQKTEAKAEPAKEIPAAAAAPAAAIAEDKTESLRKSVDERFDALTKAIEGIKETVEKIASSPAPRKGLSGLAPLRKSEAGEDNSLNKAEVVEKLLELRKSGDRRVDTSLVNRVETNRMTAEDGALVKSILA
jgi:hypothetical protein